MSMSKNIYAFGDGFAVGHVWPEWPQILSALLEDYQVHLHAGIGAGNEFIYSKFVDSYSQDSQATFLIQWAKPDRFDKLIVDDTWDSVMLNDPVYSDNQVDDWWLSSGSNNSIIRRYHDFYVQEQQSNLRSYQYIWSAYQILKNQSYSFFSTYGYDYLTDQQKNSLTDVNWAWDVAWTGMERYRLAATSELNREVRDIQPNPIVHFTWVKKILLPRLNLDFDPERLDTLEERIYNQNWIAYHPNRDNIWKKIIE